MEIITLKQEPIQTVNVTLYQQDVSIKLYQMPSMMYIDVTSDGKVLVLGIPCASFTKLIRYSYLGFQGDLFFVDYDSTAKPIETVMLNGVEINTEAPNFSQLGTRFDLYYFSPDDM